MYQSVDQAIGEFAGRNPEAFSVLVARAVLSQHELLRALQREFPLDPAYAVESFFNGWGVERARWERSLRHQGARFREELAAVADFVLSHHRN